MTSTTTALEYEVQRLKKENADLFKQNDQLRRVYERLEARSAEYQRRSEEARSSDIIEALTENDSAPTIGVRTFLYFFALAPASMINHFVSFA